MVYIFNGTNAIN